MTTTKPTLAMDTLEESNLSEDNATQDDQFCRDMSFMDEPRPLTPEELAWAHEVMAEFLSGSGDT